MRPQDFVINYDPLDPQFLGLPKFFNPNEFCDVVEQMVAADEVIRALHMLENPPGYYREKPTPRMVGLKEKILQNTVSVTHYANLKTETYAASLAHNSKLNPGFDWDQKGLGAMIDIPFCYPRGPILADLVKELNINGETPHLWEMGPSNFWLPYGLYEKDLKFTYYADTLNQASKEEHVRALEDKGIWRSLMLNQEQPQIFVCFEVIEHLWDSREILAQYVKYGAKANYVLLSTPNGTFLGGQNTLEREIEHVTTYTPSEFLKISSDLFPGYEWRVYGGQMMVVIGRKNK